LLTRCEDLAKKHQINIFTTGPHNPLCIDVELEKPATLEDAMALARTYEQRLAMTEDIPARSPPAKAPSFRTTTKPLTLTGRLSTLAAPARAQHLKRLSATEMAVKREKGECFNCTEFFPRNI
jgi:hypothetical protein